MPLAGRRLSLPAFRQALQDALTNLAEETLAASALHDADADADADAPTGAHPPGTPGAAPVVALLVVSLERSDRIACLLDDAASRAVTAQLCGRVGSMLRDADSFALVAPDELWLLLPRLRAQALALLAVNRLAHLLEPPFVQDGQAVFMRASIGIACAPQNASAVLSLLRAADQARQTARAAGNVHAISELVEGGGGLPDDIESAVKRVLSANSLTVAYQPKVDLVTGKTLAAEALVRWPADDLQYVPTVLLVETAERAGLIGALTMHVLNTVLRERQGWLRQGVDLQIWINLSAQSLAMKELPALLLQALEVWNTPPSAIGLEITESGLIRDIDQTSLILMALREAGFDLAIDDFGTGYSSLAYLRRFPISELKIDRMFVHNMVDSPQDHQIVRSIVNLAHNFNLKVVAEGAEDAATVAELKALGCDLVQGYVFARPMASDALIQWMTKPSARALRGV